MSEKPSGNEACLVVIYGLELGKKYNLNAASLVVGRSSKCDIQIDQESISRNHSKIVNTGKSILVRDLGSTNGTYVNDEQTSRVRAARRRPRQDRPHHLQVPLRRRRRGAYHEEIYRMTIIDGLTQIHNKRYLFEALEREIIRGRRHERDLSLLMFDIDHFKRINDVHGHLAGDFVLQGARAHRAGAHPARRGLRALRRRRVRHHPARDVARRRRRARRDAAAEGRASTSSSSRPTPSA